MVLTGEAFGRQITKCSTAATAIGQVIVGGNGGAALVNKDAARLQVVLQQVEDAVICSAIAAAAHGIAFIVFGDAVCRQVDEFIDAGNVDRRCHTHGTLDPRPVGTRISIMDKTGRGGAGNAGGCPLGAILVVVGEIVDRAAGVTLRLIAVGIIGVVRAKGGTGRVLVRRIGISDRRAVFGGHVANGILVHVVGAGAYRTVSGAGGIAVVIYWLRAMHT